MVGTGIVGRVLVECGRVGCRRAGCTGLGLIARSLAPCLTVCLFYMVSVCLTVLSIRLSVVLLSIYVSIPLAVRRCIHLSASLPAAVAPLLRTFSSSSWGTHLVASVHGVHGLERVHWSGGVFA